MRCPKARVISWSGGQAAGRGGRANTGSKANATTSEGMRRAGLGLAGQCPRVAKSRQHLRAGLGLTRAAAGRGPS